MVLLRLAVEGEGREERFLYRTQEQIPRIEAVIRRAIEDEDEAMFKIISHPEDAGVDVVDPSYDPMHHYQACFTKRDRSYAPSYSCHPYIPKLYSKRKKRYYNQSWKRLVSILL